MENIMQTIEVKPAPGCGFSELLTGYLERLPVIIQNVSPRTIAFHRWAIQNFSKSFDKPISEISYGEIEDFILKKATGASMRNMMLSVLDAWLNFLADRNLIDDSIAKRFTSFKKKAYIFNVAQITQRPPIESEHVKRIFQTLSIRRCNPERRERDLTVFGAGMLFLGLRINEVCNIEISEIEFHEDYRVFYVDDDESKGRDYSRESRENMFYAVIKLPWSKIKWHKPDESGYYRKVLWDVAEFGGVNFYRLLKVCYERAVSANKRFLFYNLRKDGGEGEQITPRYFERLMARTLQRAGIDIHYTPHQLRHSFAAWNYGNPDVPLHIMQDLLGHKRIINPFGPINGATLLYANHDGHPEAIDPYYLAAQTCIRKRLNDQN